MASLLRRLPAPQHKKEDEGLQVADPSVGSFQLARKADEVTTVATLNTRGPPPYGKRQGWQPRTLADYGDGGSFPEIHIAQYPLDMGRSNQLTQKVVPLQVDENGKVAWDAVLKQGVSKDKLQVWTRPEDSREKWSKTEELDKPGLELDMLNTERTQKALELQLNGKIQAGLPTKAKEKEPEFVRYTPNPNAPGYTPNCKERVIRITEKEQDPFMPPKFKHKKVPRGPPSPPPPVHHSPARKLTAKDQKDWKVPPCVSNWKNVKGYTIPLDKRLAADGRNLQDQKQNQEEHSIEAGLLLAVVERGALLGPVADDQKVPKGACRKSGVAVRVTYMYYGLAADGNISAERTRRFAKQADFRRRQLGLPHGSLVSGIGSWGGPENAPIKLFGERLTDAMDCRGGLEVIEGVSKVFMPGNLRAACQSLTAVVTGVAGAAAHAERAAQGLANKGVAIPMEQVAAFYLYTMEHNFYRQLNAAMRDPDRSKASPFFGYLRLLFAGLEALSKGAQGRLFMKKPAELWRGVHLDLHQEHSVGSEVTWWGASSCTPKLSVAKGFLGSSGARTLFTVRHLSAAPIKEFSAFRGEEEWLLAPGTRLRVESVEQKGGGLSEIMLSELPPPRDIR